MPVEDKSPIKDVSSSEDTPIFKESITKKTPLGKLTNITDKVNNGLKDLPPHEKRYLFTAIGTASIGMTLFNILTLIFGRGVISLALPFTASLIAIGALFFYAFRSARDQRLYNSPPSVSYPHERFNIKDWEKRKKEIKLEDLDEEKGVEFEFYEREASQQKARDEKQSALHEAMTKYRNDKENDNRKRDFEVAKEAFLEGIELKDREKYEREIDDYFLFHRQTRLADITGLFKNLF